MKETVIERSTPDLLDLFARVSADARKEKNSVPPTNKGIYWWTRKPLVVGRAVTLASTLDRMDAVNGSLGLDDTSRRAYLHIPKPHTGRLAVLDPFGGSGNLALSAVQMGLDVIISDYNPLAHVIQRSVLEFPARYGMRLADDVAKYSKRLIEYVENETGRFFPKGRLVYLWCWCIRCPHCGQRFPLTNHMYLARTKTRKVGIKITPVDDNFTVEVVPNITEKDGRAFTQKGGRAICIRCRNPVNYDSITRDVAKRKDREMMAIQVQMTKGRDYVVPTDADREIYESAVAHLEKRKSASTLPNENILPGHRRKNNLWNYGITHWNQYYDPRQALVLGSMLDGIRSICDGIPDAEYRRAIAVCLSILLAKRVNMAGFGVAWAVTREMPAHILTMRRPSMTYNFAESNPFEKSAGSLPNIAKNVTDLVRFATRLPSGNVRCRLESVTCMSDAAKYDLIITDPPYADDVQYGELSEFMYLWVYRALREYLPELPPRAPLDEDFCESQGRFGNRKDAAAFFAGGLKESFKSMSKKLKDDGLLVAFFAHSGTGTWNLLLEAIRESRLRVVSSYAIHTESETNVLARNKTSFMSSVVVACRKILKPSVRYMEDIKPETEKKIRGMISGFTDDQLLSVSITDLLIMAYGKVLEACTKHTELKSYERGFKPDFETLISDSRDYIMRVILRRLTGQSMSVISSDMAAYLFVKLFYGGTVGGDDILKISRTYGTDHASLIKSGMAKKTGGRIELVHLQDSTAQASPEDIHDMDLYGQLSHLAFLVITGNAARIPRALALDNFRDSHLKQLISLLAKGYRVRLNKGKPLEPNDRTEMNLLKTMADMAGVPSGELIDHYT